MRPPLALAITAAALALSTAATAQSPNLAAPSIRSFSLSRRPGAGHDSTPYRTVAGNIYEATALHHDLEPMPQLAESWEVSEDGRTYTFHLPEDVTWHGSEPFTMT